jgi:hypothetical protein
MAAEPDTRYNAARWMLNVADRWAAMNGYAHTGLEQLWRRFQVDGTIAPNYSEEVIKELLTYSATASIVLVAAILRTVGLVEKANALDSWLPGHSRCNARFNLSGPRAPRPSRPPLTIVLFGY